MERASGGCLCGRNPGDRPRAGFVNVEVQLLMVAVALVATAIVLAVVRGLAADEFWQGVRSSLGTTGVLLGCAVLVLALLYGPSLIALIRGLSGRRRKPR